jgi:hypothetical protein
MAPDSSRRQRRRSASQRSESGGFVVGSTAAPARNPARHSGTDLRMKISRRKDVAVSVRGLGLHPPEFFTCLSPFCNSDPEYYGLKFLVSRVIDRQCRTFI